MQSTHIVCIVVGVLGGCATRITHDADEVRVVHRSGDLADCRFVKRIGHESKWGGESAQSLNYDEALSQISTSSARIQADRLAIIGVSYTLLTLSLTPIDAADNQGRCCCCSA